MGGEAWGPWIEHDGTGRPVPVGTRALVHRRRGVVEETIVGCTRCCRITGRSWWVDPSVIRSSTLPENWRWAYRAPLPNDILRYRVRNLSALFDLERVAETPAPVRETEAA